MGDGYWQFNWKTEKNYADTCHMLVVEFGDGVGSEFGNVVGSSTAKFAFRKQ